MLLATINSGTLIIALPDLERALGTSLLGLVWVILAYMIASTVLVLTAGRLSDLFGRKKAYVAGFVVFALASLGAGFAGGGTELILWRIVQGIGAAFLFANAGALVTDAFPREQLGLAMGTNTMVAAIGLVLGPVLGGALVAISWHWVFWFNVPLALLGSLWGGLVLHELAKRDSVRGFDVLGTVTFVAGLTGQGFGVSRGGSGGRGGPRVERRLGRPADDRRPGGGRGAAAAVRADRARAARADARPDDLREPDVQRGARGGVHQRAVALRADVRVRLLLPGRAGRRPDHRGRQARADGAGDARLLAAGGDLRRPARVTRAGGAGHDRERHRA